jgi:tetratricopeptide (TPR) repeat protein
MIMREQMNESRENDRQILLDQVEKGLKLDAYHVDSLRYKAWLLKTGGKLGEAIEMFRGMNTPMAKRELADLYFEDQETYGELALAAYEELLQTRQTPELCFYAANCALNLGDHAKSEHYSRLALELDPDDIDSLRNLALLEEIRGNQEQALQYINRSAQCMWDAQRCYDWMIFHQVKILCRLNRPQDALKVVDDAIQRGELNGFEMKFNICCQFGLLDQAEEVLAQWKSAHPGDYVQTRAVGQLHLLRGKMLKATFAFAKIKHQMDRGEELDLRILLSELEANHKRVVELLQQKLQQNADSSHVLVNLALTLYWKGDRDSAKEAAERGLQILDQTLSRYQSDETLYRTRRSVLLAILGRVEEARAELALARTLPLCRQCTYCTCKDADIYEAYIEEITGNGKKAMELHLAGKKNWPDELDFHAGVTRLKKNKKG